MGEHAAERAAIFDFLQRVLPPIEPPPPPDTPRLAAPPVEWWPALEEGDDYRAQCDAISNKFVPCHDFTWSLTADPEKLS